MDQTYVRTTIRIPARIHDRLLRQAFNEKKSLNQIMLEWLPGQKEKNTRLERFLEGEKKLESIRKQYKKLKNRVSPADLIRQMRDERAGRV